MLRKSLMLLSHGLILTGVILIAWFGYKYVYSAVHQARLLGEFERLNPVIVVPVGRHEMGREVDEVAKDDAPEPEPIADEGPFIIEISAIGVQAAIVDGVSESDLAMGPGFYDGRPRPGEDGNVAIAAHRTTYGAWFRRVDELEPGDIVQIRSPIAIYSYEVERVFAVARDAWEVVGPTEEPSLTLTTCHPPGSDRQRLVVRARLTSIERMEF